MKIIHDAAHGWTLKVTCTCRSVLQIDKNDLIVKKIFFGPNYAFYYECPCCFQINLINNKIIPPTIKIELCINYRINKNITTAT